MIAGFRFPQALLLAAALAALSAQVARAGTLGEDWFLYNRLAMSGQEINALFGRSAAISGDWAIIGAPGDDNGPQDVGRIEFWQRVPSQGSWARRSIVFPILSTSSDLLGENVDIDGDFAVATAKGLDWLGDEFVGAAIALRRSGTSWVIDGDGELIDPDGPVEFNGYGDDVAISGDTIAVGYKSAESGGVQRGKVDLFVRGAAWDHLQTINGTIDGLRVPDDLDIEGDTLVFGASRANGFVGEVYVYERSGGIFSLAQTLGPQGPNGAFGIELALNGDRLAVLAVDALEIFERVGGAWQPLQVIIIPGLELGSGNPGEVLAFSGDRIQVTLSEVNEVRSFVFDGNQFQPETTLATPTEVFSLASGNGTRLMVGRPTESSNRGAVDLYEFALNTATTIGISPSPSLRGNATTISVTVRSDTFTPNGRVFIEREGAFLCTIAPLLAGAGSCTSQIGPPGDHEITARYDADVGFADSLSPPFMHTVLATPTTTTITSDAPDPSPAGTPVVVTYAVGLEEGRRAARPAGDPPPVPTGNVTVTDGIDSCIGTVGQGQCTLVLTTPGTRDLVASYEGDELFAASSSAPEPHVVIIAADLLLDKRQCSDLTRPGATHRFLLRVANEGPSLAEAVEVVDELPAGMLFLAASENCSEAAGVVTCSLGNLAAGATMEEVIEVTVSSDAELSMINTASVTSLTEDPSLANNSDLTVTVRLDQLINADGFEFCGRAP